MVYNRIKFIATSLMVLSLVCVSTKAAYAETTKVVYAENVQNESETNLQNDSNDYKISRNWLTEEVAAQLNKEWDNLTVEDFSYIVKIDCPDKRLSGEEIPKEIELLTNVEYINFNYCKLEGDIPSSIAKLSKLKHLDLGDNRFSSISEEVEKKIENGDYDYCDVEGNQFKLNKGWRYLKGKWSYFDRYGERLTGEQTIDNVKYDFGEEGIIKEGWEEKDGVKHYYDRVSGMVKNAWKQINNKWYYFNEDGVMLTGLQNILGTKFYLSETGEMLTGIQNIDGKYYSFCDRGGMQYGLISINGKIYYFDESTGEMSVNTEKNINGKRYVFGADGSGVSQENTWIDEYTYVQPNGQTVNTYSGYSHSNTNYQLFKYMTYPQNQVSVDQTAVALHGGITSNNCVYFASEAMRRVGLSLPTSTCNTYDLENKLVAMGFVPCYDLSQLKPGDIVFTNGYTHVYIFMCWDTNGYAYIVDNQSYNFDNKILHRRQVYQDTATTDRATHFYYYPY